MKKEQQVSNIHRLRKDKKLISYCMKSCHMEIQNTFKKGSPGSSICHLLRILISVRNNPNIDQIVMGTTKVEIRWKENTGAGRSVTNWADGHNVNEVVKNRRRSFSELTSITLILMLLRLLNRANRVNLPILSILIHLLVHLVGLPNNHDRLGERHVVQGEF